MNSDESQPLANRWRLTHNRRGNINQEKNSRIDELILQLAGPNAHEAAQELATFGEPALEKLLRISEDSIAYDWSEQPNPKQLNDNLNSALLLSAKANPDTFLTIAQTEKRLNNLHVVWTLGQLDDEQSVQLLTIALRSDNEHVRWAAAHALEDKGDARAVEPLIEALKDKSPSVHTAAANALSSIGDERAVGPLVSLLNCDDSRLQRSAIDALGQIGDPSAIEPLQQIVEEEDTPFPIRMAAKAAVGKIRRQGEDDTTLHEQTPSFDKKLLIGIGLAGLVVIVLSITVIVRW